MKRKGTKFSERYAGVKTNKRICNIGGLASNGIVCEICGTACKSISGMSTHLLRKHKMDLIEYYKRFFTNTNPDFVIEQCAFCDHDARVVKRRRARPQEAKLNAVSDKLHDAYKCSITYTSRTC